MKKASLYIHIPFCAKKCAYCDFESYAGRLDRADEYISRVTDEARGYGVIGVPTVFLGGGTPSLLSAEQMTRLLGNVFETMPPDKDAEITMEANPGTVNGAKLTAAKRAGVNRISFGVQAVQQHLLESLGRIHTYKEAEASVKLAQDAGITNINCDVMYGLPGQRTEDLLETVDTLCGLGIKHISCYSLILEKGTCLYEKVESGEAVLPTEDEICEMQEALVNSLADKGFERYEISNYALPGCECRHNTVYWTGKDYIGLGCAAHSFMNNERFSNPDFDTYMKGINHVESEFVDEEGRLEEMLLLGTRMKRGVSLETFGSKAGNIIKEASKRKYDGMIKLSDGGLSFTDAGLMVHNALVLELVNSLY